MGAANFVYQFTIFTACVGILQMPYAAAINAHERMKVYAYAGLADAALKLAVALALGFAPFDRLEFYAVLLFAVYAAMNIFYFAYCRWSFPETRFNWFWDKKMFLERVRFSGYEFLGGISGVLAVHGGSILLNRFYGVLLNAANGVSQQVAGASQQFADNFILAVVPQITKSFAAGEMERFYGLVIRSSKFCFLLSFMLMAPLALQMDFVLGIWLKEVPGYAGIFCQLAIANLLVYTSFLPVFHGIIATGKNEAFRKADSFMIMIMFPIAYLGLHFSPIGYICSRILVNAFRMIYWVFTLRKLTGFPIRRLASQSLARCFAVGAISVPLPIYIALNMSGWQGFFTCVGSFLMLFAASAWFVGLNVGEREKVAGWVKGKFLYYSKI
jgi:O-antigen/teichoic acid export membrane protein